MRTDLLPFLRSGREAWQTKHQSREFRKINSSTISWLVLSVSFVVTFLAWYISSGLVKDAANSRFNFAADDIRSTLAKRIKEQESVLWGGVGLFNSVGEVNRNHWRNYVGTLNLRKNLPGLEGYGYAEYVLHEDKSEHLAKIRGEGFRAFDITPAGNREYYTSNIYLEPFKDGNLKAFGYDMFSDAVRRSGLERARDSGGVGITGMISLVQGGERRRGFIMSVPVYEHGVTPPTVAEKRTNLKGFVYSVFRAAEFMEEVVGVSHNNLHLRVWDGAKESSILYDSENNYSTELEGESGQFYTKRRLRIADHNWILEFHSGPTDLLDGEQYQPLLVAGASILIDILLFFMITALAGQRQRAQALAESTIEELEIAKDKAEFSARTETNLRAETQAANERLSLANDRLLRFTKVVAHDLRAPLKRVESFVTILFEDHYRSLDDEAQDVLTRLNRSSSRMRLMLESLQNYSRYNTIYVGGKTADPNIFVSQALEILQSDIGDAKVVTQIPEGCLVRGDNELLLLVSQNLISNSLKFRGEAPVRISIEVEKINPNRVRIVFSDNGIGIPPEFHEKIFEMFARLHNEDEYEGTGIGLSICQKIILDHGGNIYLDPLVEVGASFVIELNAA